jgi:exopolyphosphatase/guanosine-5'-triphosphate,3'-diphosphate pyrophosphatase
MEMQTVTSPEIAESRIVAVIDIGATSVRMMIAEIRPDGTTSELEALTQAVQLGRDSFVTGEISRGTIEDCVRVLRIYREKLREYGIDRPGDVRVVATSAVREASNRLAFSDRVYIATGFAIEPFDEASLHRTTFIGIKPILDRNPHLNEGQTVICEVGGGTTEVLTMENGMVSSANTYRLGSLRLIKTLEAYQAPLSRSRDLMESQIEKISRQILASLGESENRHLVVMGGDMRLAAAQISPGSPGSMLVTLPLDEFDRFTRRVMVTTPDALVTRYQLSVNEAQSLAPALMTNLHLAHTLGVDCLHVARVNLREGLIKDLLSGEKVIRQADRQILDSAVALGRRFKFDEPHALHVAELADSLFRQTANVHELGDPWRLLLRIAAILHEVGRGISERSYHKHSMYIIRNSSLFGISSRDLDYVALIARYHRRALPQLRHEAYSQLNRDDRASISKLAAILRIAKALDASRGQRVGDIRCEVTGSQLRIFVPGLTDLTLEQLELRRERVLFETIFGLHAELAAVPPAAGNQP